jgi:phosphopantothenoylcysteine decarboxylase/phosphopantothenate--cysteine ligase
MAAAPADFRPAEYADSKIKKSAAGPTPTLTLVANPDIAAELGERKREGQLLVAFAAETAEASDAVAQGREKLRRKRADLIVINQVGPDRVFGQETNAVTVLGADGTSTEISEAAKEEIADAVWDLVVARLA